jgi:hypothetical protein
VQHLLGNKINDTTSDKAKKIYGVFPGMNMLFQCNSLQNPLSVFDHRLQVSSHCIKEKTSTG